MIASITNRFLDLVQRWSWMLGCVLVALIFIVSAWGKLMNPHGTAAFMRDAGIPLSGALMYVVIAVELLGGIALAVGFRLQSVAFLLAGFMVPATLTAHAFWSATPDMYSAQLTNLLKNTAIVGSLLIVAGYFAQLTQRFGSERAPKADVAAGRANA